MDPVPMFLLESLGLSLVYAVVITYFFNANPLQGAAPEDTVFSRRCALLLGIAIPSVYFGFLGRSWMHMAGRTRKVFTTVFACVAMLPAVGRLFAYPALNFYVECSANVLAGIGLGMMIVSWAELFTPYWQKTVGGYIAFAFGGGAILGMFMSSMDPFYQAAAQIGACAVSFALLAVCYPRSELGNAAKQPIPKHWVMPIGIELIMLAYSISFGLLFSLLFDHAAVAVDAPFVCLAILLGTCLYGFVVAFFKKYIPFSFLQKIILPFISLLLLCTPFAIGHSLPILVLAMTAICTLVFFDLGNLCSLVAMTTNYAVPPLYIVVRGRLFYYSGLFAGWAIGYALFGFGAIPESNTFFVFCAIAIILIGFVTLTPFEVKVVENQERPEAPAFDEKHYWYKRCKEVAEAYGLSNRELDVLSLLSKGRNAKYIEKTLFISENTVKTHVSHIYKKLNINSQQTLIDLVDDFEPVPQKPGENR